MSESRLYRPLIELAAAAHDLDPDLVEAIVTVESQGLTHAYRYEPVFWQRYLADEPQYAAMNPRRAAASYGLMQVMYPVAVERGFKGEPEELFVPAIGLEYGCRHLAAFVKVVGLPRAVAAYNGGLGSSRQPFRPEIALYVQKVFSARDAIIAARAARAR